MYVTDFEIHGVATFGKRCVVFLFFLCLIVCDIETSTVIRRRSKLGYCATNKNAFRGLEAKLLTLFNLGIIAELLCGSE